MNTFKPKFTLKLNETNTLGFAITIEGTSPELGSTQPVYRFVLSEENDSRAFVYPMSRDDEGDVTVTIPTETFFIENKLYQGNVEVLLGNHYFVPASVDIEFIKPLKVEAVAKVKSKPTFIDETNVISTNATPSIKNKSVKQTAVTNTKPVVAENKKSWNDLSKAEQEKIVQMLREKKMSDLRKAKETGKTTKESANKAEAAIKNQMKSLMADSLFEEEE
jgi:hypothetical protein